MRFQLVVEFSDSLFDFRDEQFIEFACDSINVLQASQLQSLQSPGGDASFSSHDLASGCAFDPMPFRFPADQSIGDIRDV